jgi:hypothetical protein
MASQSIQLYSPDGHVVECKCWVDLSIHNVPFCEGGLVRVPTGFGQGCGSDGPGPHQIMVTLLHCTSPLVADCVAKVTAEKL